MENSYVYVITPDLFLVMSLLDTCTCLWWDCSSTRVCM